MPDERVFAELLPVFAAAGEAAVALVSSDEVRRAWASPSALEGYTVGDVAAHLYQAVRRFEKLLDDPEPAGPVASAGAYYGNARVMPDLPENVALHAALRDASHKEAERGPETVADRFAGLIARLVARLPSEDADRKVATRTMPGHVSTLAEYVRTRIVELVVHTDDLAASVGVEVALPDAAVAVTVDVLVGIVRERDGDLAAMRALCRTERAGPDVLRAL